jgi:glycerol uptake facilitator-like aquaporin
VRPKDDVTRRGPLSRRALAEAVATAFLLAGIVGSGIMGERLAGGNVAIALLANSLATGALLAVLIAAFGPLSGAHLNPVVTIAAALRGELRAADLAAYAAAQCAGALLGVAAAHAMFELAPFAPGTHPRSGPAQLLSEFVATLGLVLTILACASRTRDLPYLVGAYIAAAYWFTGSTSFANPAVTLARAATDTFAGIRPVDVSGFVAAQLAGGAAALALWRALAPEDGS